MLFWLPKYFSATYDVDLKIILLPMIIMYLLSDAGSILGGWVSSKLIQTGHSVNFARKVTMIGAGLCVRSEEHTSELQSLMRISYAVFCLKKKKAHNTKTQRQNAHNIISSNKTEHFIRK